MRSSPLRRFFDFLRSADGLPETGRRVKAWILEQHQTQKAAVQATLA
jgi:hypothetical protein